MRMLLLRDTVLRTLLCEEVAVRCCMMWLLLCDTVLRTLLCEDVAAVRYGAV